MKIKQLLAAICVSVFMQSTNAALVTSTTTNGNIVDDYTYTYGISELEVTFNNLQSVQIDFDNSFAYQDDIFMNIYNNTGASWTGFDFELVGVGIFGPFTAGFNTGTLINALFHENDLATGLASGVELIFGDSEDVGLYNVAGSVNTSYVQTYSLILTPTTVPVPAAVWLFGSGLLGLIGVARRKAICKVS